MTFYIGKPTNNPPATGGIKMYNTGLQIGSGNNIFLYPGSSGSVYIGNSVNSLNKVLTQKDLSSISTTAVFG